MTECKSVVQRHAVWIPWGRFWLRRVLSWDLFTDYCLLSFNQILFLIPDLLLYWEPITTFLHITVLGSITSWSRDAVRAGTEWVGGGGGGFKVISPASICCWAPLVLTSPEPCCGSSVNPEASSLSFCSFFFHPLIPDFPRYSYKLSTVPWQWHFHLMDNQGRAAPALHKSMTRFVCKVLPKFLVTTS